MPKVIIELEPSEVHLLPVVMRVLESDYEGEPEAAQPEPEAPAEDKPRAGTAEALLNDPTQPGQSTGSSAAELMAKTKMKPTSSVGLRDGSSAKTGDYVVNNAGEEGCIAMTYRGNAIVEFEDGSAEMIKGAELDRVATEDDGGEPEPAQEPEKTEAKPNGKADDYPHGDGDGPLNNSQATTLRNKANSLIEENKATPKEVFAILADYGAEKFDQVKRRDFSAVNTKLEALLNVDNSDSKHGF